MPVSRRKNGIGLVAMKIEWAVFTPVFPAPENTATFGVKNFLSDQIINASSALERWIQLDQWIGPENPF
jgi:hypothetical protein